MSDKKNTNKPTGLGELTTIRDILMGQQIEEYEHRFQEIQENFSSATDQIYKRMKELEAQTNHQLENLEAEIKTRLEVMEKKIAEKTQDLTTVIERTNSKSTQSIGKMLIEMGKKLSSE